ncbi:MAG: hypothetical protein WAK26_10725, partial [Terracidiphilus sp.]
MVRDLQPEVGIAIVISRPHWHRNHGHIGLCVDISGNASEHDGVVTDDVDFDLGSFLRVRPFIHGLPPVRSSLAPGVKR